MSHSLAVGAPSRQRSRALAHRRRAQIASLLVASLLSACGGGGGGGGGGSGNAAPSPTPSSNGSTTVTTTTTAPPVLVAGTPTYTSTYRTDAFDRLNAVRLSAGLGALAQNSNLDVAAQSHSAYQADNNTIAATHAETAGLLDFTGVDVASRMTAAGYSYRDPSTEVVAPGAAGAESVDALMALVFHRQGLLKPGLRDVGIGAKVNAAAASFRFLTIDLGTQASQLPQAAVASYAVWPLDLATNVPILHLNENPNPVATELGAWCAPNCPGYPVSIHFDNDNTTVSSFVLRTASGATVSTKMFGIGVPGDTLSSTFWSTAAYGYYALVPLAPLATSATYTATFSGTVNGKAVNKTWSFTTRANVVTAAQTAYTTSRSALAAAGDRLVVKVVSPSGFATVGQQYNTATNSATPITCDRGATASPIAALSGGDAQIVNNLSVSDPLATCVVTLGSTDPVTHATGPAIAVTFTP